jgi:hypothetical protein
MICDQLRRMLRDLDELESVMNDRARSQTERSEAAQQAHVLTARIRDHRETHEGCDYKPTPS